MQGEEVHPGWDQPYAMIRKGTEKAGNREIEVVSTVATGCNTYRYQIIPDRCQMNAAHERPGDSVPDP